MKKIKKNSASFFKTKKTTALFSLISLIGGVFFLKYKITGNAVLSNNYPLSPLFLISLLLFLCSVILVIYTIRNLQKR